MVVNVMFAEPCFRQDVVHPVQHPTAQGYAVREPVIAIMGMGMIMVFVFTGFDFVVGVIRVRIRITTMNNVVTHGRPGGAYRQPH